MLLSYYRVQFPSYLSINVYDCPVNYYMKKYSFINHLPLPKALTISNRETIICIPSSVEADFIDILITFEDCVTTFIKREEYSNELSDTFVYENKKNVNGNNINELCILTR